MSEIPKNAIASLMQQVAAATKSTETKESTTAAPPSDLSKTLGDINSIATKLGLASPESTAGESKVANPQSSLENSILAEINKRLINNSQIADFKASLNDVLFDEKTQQSIADKLFKDKDPSTRRKIFTQELIKMLPKILKENAEDLQIPNAVINTLGEILSKKSDTNDQTLTVMKESAAEELANLATGRNWEAEKKVKLSLEKLSSSALKVLAKSLSTSPIIVVKALLSSSSLLPNSPYAFDNWSIKVDRGAVNALLSSAFVDDPKNLGSIIITKLDSELTNHDVSSHARDKSTGASTAIKLFADLLSKNLDKLSDVDQTRAKTVLTKLNAIMLDKGEATSNKPDLKTIVENTVVGNSSGISPEILAALSKATTANPGQKPADQSPDTKSTGALAALAKMVGIGK